MQTYDIKIEGDDKYNVFKLNCKTQPITEM